MTINPIRVEHSRANPILHSNCQHGCVNAWGYRVKDYACPWHHADGESKDMTLPRHERDLFKGDYNV